MSKFTDKFIENVSDEALIEELLGRGFALSIWSVEDVFSRCEDRDLMITEKEASNILSIMQSKHDANIGFNWDVLDIFIDEVLDA
jgi:uncharacterized protein CbrC (UPF0167 family)